MRRSPKDYAAELLDKLKTTDAKTSAAYYEMGQYLAALDHGLLYKELGYRSISALITEELSFCHTTGMNYMSTYRHFKRLKYSKEKSIKLITKYGWSHASKAVKQATPGITDRGMTKRIKVARAAKIQFNFQFHTEKDVQEVRKALIKYGAVEKQSGKLEESSAALLNLIRSRR